MPTTAEADQEPAFVLQHTWLPLRFVLLWHRFRRIDNSLWLTRARVALRVFANQAFRTLGLSLTLGGVFYTAIEVSSVPPLEWLSTVGLLIFPAATIVVALISTSGLSLEHRARSIRQLYRNHPETALKYMLFHTRNLALTLRIYTELLLAATSERDSQKHSAVKRIGITQARRSVDTLTECPDVLAAALHDLFHLGSADAFLDHFCIRPARITGDAAAYLNALQARNGRQGEIAKSLLRQSERIWNAADPLIAWEVLRIATVPGTSSAISLLVDVVYHIQLRQDPNGAKKVAMAASKARRFPLTLLADLEPWSKGEEHDIPLLQRARLESTKGAAKNFQALAEMAAQHLYRRQDLRESTKSELASSSQELLSEISKHDKVRVAVRTSQDQRPPTKYRLSVATIGYSSATVDALRRARDLIGSVYILQLDKRFLGADLLMRERLENLGLHTELVEESTLLNSGVRTQVDIAIFGFGAAATSGELLHRRSLETIIRPINDYVQPRLGIVGIGESWKVRDFSDRWPEIESVASIHKERLLALITDCGLHLLDSMTPSLECCVAHWRETRSRDAPPPPPGSE